MAVRTLHPVLTSTPPFIDSGYHGSVVKIITRDACRTVKRKKMSDELRSSNQVRRVKSCPQPFDLILQIACSKDSADTEFIDAKRLFGLLRQQGNDIELDVINASGMTALTQCVLDGNFKSVQVLVQLGADVNKRDRQGWTAMHHAASEGYMDIVRFLLKCNADVRIQNRKGQTPLDLAETDELRKLLGRVTLFYSPLGELLLKRASLPVWL